MIGFRQSAQIQPATQPTAWDEGDEEEEEVRPVSRPVSAHAAQRTAASLPTALPPDEDEEEEEEEDQPQAMAAAPEETEVQAFEPLEESTGDMRRLMSERSKPGSMPGSQKSLKSAKSAKSQGSKGSSRPSSKQEWATSTGMAPKQSPKNAGTHEQGLGQTQRAKSDPSLNRKPIPINEFDPLPADKSHWQDDTKLLDVRESQYIPLSLARKQIKKVLADMLRMRIEHLTVCEEMEAIKGSLKQRAEEQIAAYIAKLNSEQEEIDTQHAQEMASVKTKMQEQRDQYETVIKDLREENEELYSKHSAKQADVENERRLWKAKVEKEQEQFKKAKDNFETVKQGLTDKIATMKEELKEKDKLSQGQSGDASKLKADLTKLTSENKALTNTVKEMNARIEKKEAELELTQNETIELKAELKNKALEAEDLGRSGDKKHTTSSADAGELAEIKEKLEEKEVENNKLKRALKKAMKDKAKPAGEGDDKKETEDKPSEDNSKLQEELVETKDRMKKLEKKLIKYKKVMKETEGTQKELEENNTILIREKLVLQEKLDVGTAHLDSGDSDKALREARLQIELKQKEIDRLEKQVAQIKDLQEALETEQAANKKLEADLLNAAGGESDAVKERMETLHKDLQKAQEEKKKAVEHAKEEGQMRKKYYNAYQDSKGKIRVYTRFRPPLESEQTRLDQPAEMAPEFPDNHSLRIAAKNKDFVFDRVFPPPSTQDTVWEETRHLVQSACDGYNVCIFAYGETGAGKTYTMIGGEDPGVTPRAILEVFHTLRKNLAITYKVSSSLIEINNDQLFDLYLPIKQRKAAPPLEIKKDSRGMVFIQNAVVQQATDEAELSGQFDMGLKGRHIKGTSTNSDSSRAHLLFSIMIETKNKVNDKVSVGKMSLLDLAGSEKLDSTVDDPEVIKQSKAINKSLSALGDVIQALASNDDNVPYKSNKLTLLMSDSLGGNAKTLMVCCASPATQSVDETVTSLTYASRVKMISNKAQMNSDAKEVARLRQIIKKLQAGELVDEAEIAEAEEQAEGVVTETD